MKSEAERELDRALNAYLTCPPGHPDTAKLREELELAKEALAHERA